jgi:muramoyltetrapeptide carboxypeptidase
MLKTPPPLQKGDTVCIVAPGKAIPPALLEDAVRILKSWGLHVKMGHNLFKNHHQFSATDTERLQDLQDALDNPEVKAILCARGGYGTTRIIDQLKWSAFKKSPKWVVGFSDITVLLARIEQEGYQAIHGPMPVMFGLDGAEKAVNSLKNILFGEQFSYSIEPHALNEPGEARGTLTGGTITLLCNSIGTSTETSLNGKILFLEDVGEYLYTLDRMMVQLRRSGKLAGLAGLLVGTFADMKDNTEIPFGKSVEEIIKDATRGYSYPKAFGFPVGHVAHNVALPCGREVTLSVNKEKTLLTDSLQIT